MGGDCGNCGERSDDLRTMDLSDQSVGYVEYADWCPACRREDASITWLDATETEPSIEQLRVDADIEAFMEDQT